MSLHRHVEPRPGESAPFHLESLWWLAATPNAVWATFSRVRDWPDWWPGVRAAALMPPADDESGAGTPTGEAPASARHYRDLTLAVTDQTGEAAPPTPAAGTAPKRESAEAETEPFLPDPAAPGHDPGTANCNLPSDGTGPGNAGFSPVATDPGSENSCRDIVGANHDPRNVGLNPAPAATAPAPLVAGTRARVRIRTPFGHDLAVTLTLEDLHAPDLARIEVSGDLRGTGTWRAHRVGAETRVDLVWCVVTRRRWIRALRPFAIPAHARVMSAGRDALNARLARARVAIPH